MNKITLCWQKLLWCLGIAWHNLYRDECTPDFNCCQKVGRKSWWRIAQKKKKYPFKFVKPGPNDRWGHTDVKVVAKIENVDAFVGPTKINRVWIDEFSQYPNPYPKDEL